jgi:tRNA(Ile)-lysidine synthase
MLAPGERVVAAVSGGPDSVCLLDVLSRLAPSFNTKLAGVAHLNHKLRGADSDADEKFVEQLAGRYGLAFYGEAARLERGNLEQAARRARLRFFARLLNGGAGDRIATGHTRDDQAETVLFRILRGSGPTGLAGILPVTGEGLIRPLLAVGRADVLEYLQARRLGWREDITNISTVFSRNRIRHDLLPQLAREWNPHIAETLARFADIAYEDERCWDQEIQKIAATKVICVEGGLEIAVREFAALPKAVARRLIRHMIARVRGDRRPLALEHISRVLELAKAAEGEGTVNLPEAQAIRSFGVLRLHKSALASNRTLDVDVPGRYNWGGSVICFSPNESASKHAICARLKLRGPGELQPLQLRSWRAGDHYRPAGKSREYTIHELFQRARVPSWKRHAWPVLCVGSEIVWARQFGAAEEFTAMQPGPAICIWEEYLNE